MLTLSGKQINIDNPYYREFLLLGRVNALTYGTMAYLQHEGH
jgi:hypothetical protein